ncbi:MAG TPA: hypothetical protein VKB45_17635 [Gemmatimonadales bacterium]|nr:hypothetical protein [Gemmatimonadales bacterium]
MTGFLLPRASLPARVTLTAGKPRMGTIFVGARVPQHDGPETPLEMLNRPETFFPFRPNDGEILLVAKGQTVALTIDQGPIIDPDRLSAAKQVELELVFANGSTMFGRAAVELPEQHSRALDYLNSTSAPFFELSTDESIHYVNRAHVLFARPRD